MKGEIIMKTNNLTMIRMNNGSQALSHMGCPDFCYAFFQTGSLIGIGLRI